MPWFRSVNINLVLLPGGVGRLGSRLWEPQTPRTPAQKLHCLYGFVYSKCPPDFYSMWAGLMLTRLMPPIFLSKGPPSQAMWSLGDKIASSIVAQTAGIPTLPWSGTGLLLLTGNTWKHLVNEKASKCYLTLGRVVKSNFLIRDHMNSILYK